MGNTPDAANSSTTASLDEGAVAPAAPATPATPAAPPAPPADDANPTTPLDDVVDRLQTVLDELTAAVSTGESKLNEQTQRGAVIKADLTVAKKSAEAYAGAKNAAELAIRDSGMASAAAQVLIDTLAPDDVKKLTAKINEVDKRNQEALQTLNDAESALEAHQIAVKDQESTVVSRTEVSNSASTRLSQHIVATKSLVATVKTLTRELNADAAGGKALKAFVQESALAKDTEKLKGMLDVKEIKALAVAYDEALVQLTTARAALAKQIEGLAPKKAAVVAAQANVQQVAARGKVDLTNLFTLPKSTATPA